ncbi:hypothetical protein KC361_g262 [Hortaea werneckii]|nr:hypothetical protein KC361_g262 [Hortaea werneckii]
MSNSQSERSEPRSPGAKSPLPTLTSTPSSAYANSRPKQIRRPSNGEPKQVALNAAQRPNSSAAVFRPSLSRRTSIEPANDRSSSAANTPTSHRLQISTIRRVVVEAGLAMQRRGVGAFERLKAHGSNLCTRGDPPNADWVKLARSSFLPLAATTRPFPAKIIPALAEPAIHAFPFFLYSRPPIDGLHHILRSSVTSSVPRRSRTGASPAAQRDITAWH